MMNRKSTPAIPEPIAELQRQLDQFRNTQPRRTKLPSRCGRLPSNWRGNTVSIRWRTRYGWTIWG